MKSNFGFIVLFCLLLSACASDPFKAPYDQNGPLLSKKIKINQ